MSPLTRKAAPSIQACLHVFLLDVKSRRLSSQSIRFHEQQLRFFLGWLKENGADPNEVSITDLDRNDIRQYLSDRTEDGLAAASVDACYRALSAFCNFCVAEGWVEVSVMANVKRSRKEEKIPPAFTSEEIEQLLHVCDTGRDKTILLFLLDTGCRAQEMLDLNIEDVNLTTGSVNIRRGKGAKQRFAFIGFRTRKQLSLYLAGREGLTADAPVFISEKGTRLKYDGLKSLMRHSSLEILKHYARLEGVDVAAAHQQ